MTIEETRSVLAERLGDGIGEVVRTATPFIPVTPSVLREAARILRDDLSFETLICLSGVDTMGMKADTSPPPVGDDGKPGKSPPPAEALWVVYHLESVSRRDRAALKVVLDRNHPVCPSVADIWNVAEWHEREAFDMFGIRFEGHPDPRRILCPEDWVGHPLLKDYEFPESYGGIPRERLDLGEESI